MQRPVFCPAGVVRFPAAASATRLPNGAFVHSSSKLQTSFVYNEVFNDRCYSQHGVSLRPGDTVVDVGANVGLFALFAASCGASRVACCEPSPRTFAELQRTLSDRRNEATFRSCETVPLNVAVGGQNGSVSFTSYERLPAWSTIGEAGPQLTDYEAEVRRNVCAYADAQGDAALAVWGPLRSPLRFLARVARAPVLTSAVVSWLLARKRTSPVALCTVASVLQTLTRVHGWAGVVHFLKIDVERGEWDVLKGVGKEDWIRILQVVAEVHDVPAPGGGASRLEEVVALLCGAGGFMQKEVVTVRLVAQSNLWMVYASRRARYENESIKSG
jgi:FkbM family methyltransferase